MPFFFTGRACFYPGIFKTFRAHKQPPVSQIPIKFLWFKIRLFRILQSKTTVVVIFHHPQWRSDFTTIRVYIFRSVFVNGGLVFHTYHRKILFTKLCFSYRCSHLRSFLNDVFLTFSILSHLVPKISVDRLLWLALPLRKRASHADAQLRSRDKGMPRLCASIRM